MPSTSYTNPLLSTRNENYEIRGRDWVRTPGYGSVPRPPLPINYLSDGKVKGSQTYHSGYYRTTRSNGAIYWIQSPGYRELGSTIKAWHDQCYTNSKLGDAITSATNEAKIKALVKAADQKVNVSVALAEAAKTSNLILDTATRVSRAYRSFRRGNLREVARQLDISPNRVHKTWLQYKYGWMPLLMDVKNGAEFFAQQTLGRSTKFVVSAVVNGTKTYSRTTYWGGLGTPPTYFYFTESFSGEYRVKVKLWLELTSPTYSTVQQLGLTNPALIVWELVPFSFVFDWFISVGDYLVARSALDGITVRKGMLSIVDATKWFGNNPGCHGSDTNYYYDYGSSQFSWDRRQYTRSSYVPTSFDLYPPVNTNALGFQKLVTSLALLKGLRR